MDKKKYNVQNLAKGSKKGRITPVNRIIRDILQENKYTLIGKAVKMAENGNTAVLCKLLDKLLPTITEQTNINKGLTFEEFVRQQLLQRQQLPPQPQALQEVSGNNSLSGIMTSELTATSKQRHTITLDRGYEPEQAEAEYVEIVPDKA